LISLGGQGPPLTLLEIRSLVESQHKEEAVQRFIRIRTAFPPLPVLSQQELRSYRLSLSDESSMSPVYHNFEYDSLKTTAEFQNWLSLDHSSLLLLKGRTCNSRSSENSWLSLAAIDLFMSRATSHDATGVFCRVRFGMEAHQVLWMIICQYLEIKPELAQEDIRAQRSSEAWKHAEPKEPCSMLSKVLESFPSTVIVIDRLDRCECDGVIFLHSLLETVQNSRAVFKLFVVFEESSPSRKLSQEDIDVWGDNDHFQVLNIDQKSDLVI